jgi:hypothetical protein
VDTEEPGIAPARADYRHVAEHVLSSLSRVINRDSDNTSASLEDLFTAVAEDEAIWGFFKRMQGKLEQGYTTNMR